MNYFIGIDPDLRTLSAAVVDENKKVLAVFVRRNTGGMGDFAVAVAARIACRLVEDVIAFFIANISGESSTITLVVESQNIQYTGHTNTARKQNVLQLAQVAGCLMGAFSNLSDKIILVQPVSWKGNIPKDIHHKRIYNRLGLQINTTNTLKNISPANIVALGSWSQDRINPGDFADINDSLGLALYGVEKGK